ncbi:MAG: glycosyltransferase family 2 protein [Gemmatimonadetes bacterium]|nr:glycosyltransferase family 2 protein [Gemmatimonadota bacterium]
MPTITAYLITRNAERHLDEVLRSVEGVDDILVVDSGSTDATLEIARRHGARVIHQEWLGYARQKAFALRSCQGEWALNLDADEVLPPGALDAIRTRISRGDVNGIYLLHDDTFMGRPMPGKRLPFLRVYRHAKARFDESMEVHERVHVEGPLDRLPIPVRHYGYDSIQDYVDKLNRYSLLKAGQRAREGRPFSRSRLLLTLPLTFLKFYLLRRMCLAGWRGFIKAVVDSYYFFLTEAKLYEQAYREQHE